MARDSAAAQRGERIECGQPSGGVVGNPIAHRSEVIRRQGDGARRPGRALVRLASAVGRVPDLLSSAEAPERVALRRRVARGGKANFGRVGRVGLDLGAGG